MTSCISNILPYPKYLIDRETDVFEMNMIEHKTCFIRDGRDILTFESRTIQNRKVSSLYILHKTKDKDKRLDPDLSSVDKGIISRVALLRPSSHY